MSTGPELVPVLEVENLTVALRTSRGIRRAVDGISFSIGAGRDPRDRGRKRLRQDPHCPVAARPAPVGCPHIGQRALRGAGAARAQASPAARCPGQAGGAGLAGPGHRAPSAAQDRRPDDRARPGAPRASRKNRPANAPSRCSPRCGSPTPKRRSSAYPHQFSGGMRQRIAIAMALACEPRLLIADEPTTALDVTVQAGILRLLDRLRRERGVSVMIITHDLGVLSSIADRICVLYGGRVAEYGTTPTVLGSPRHPYTRGLMQSLPGASAAGDADGPDTGRRRPSLDAMPGGCAFHPRCEWAQEQLPHDRPDRCELSRTAAGWRATSTRSRPAGPGPARCRWARSPLGRRRWDSLDATLATASLEMGPGRPPAPPAARTGGPRRVLRAGEVSHRCERSSAPRSP